jgi:hypothetical protein
MDVPHTSECKKKTTYQLSDTAIPRTQAVDVGFLLDVFQSAGLLEPTRNLVVRGLVNIDGFRVFEKHFVQPSPDWASVHVVEIRFLKEGDKQALTKEPSKV